MVLSCSEFKEDLSAFLDDELEEQQQSVLAEHLLVCAPCRHEHDRFKGLGGLLRKVNNRVSENAPDLWQSLSARLPDVCQCIQDDLSAYLDGELLAPAKEGVNEHLESCKVCLEKFQKLSRVNTLLSAGLALPESVNVDLWAAVKARLNDDCVLIRSELSPFVDREVATLRHRAITAHLTECEQCTGEFTALSETGDLLRSHYQPEIPPDLDLWPAVKSRLNVIPLETREKRRPTVAARRLSAIAAVVVAGVMASAGFMWYTQTTTPQVQPVTAEAYLIDQSLGDPADIAEAVVYDHTP